MNVILAILALGSLVSTNGVKSVSVKSRSSELDRKAGVVLFEGDVVVRYSDGYVMNADQLYMFLSRESELSRVVALGNVVISNETRTGSCAMATYRRRKGEVEMFWDGKGKLAELADLGENASETRGTRIKFWLDAEQVEVDDSQLSLRQGGDFKVL